jgi:hypothetical protein
MHPLSSSWFVKKIMEHLFFAGLASLILLNLNRCGMYDEGCENFKGKLK